MINSRHTIIFISGPIYTGGDALLNIRRGLETAATIRDRGYLVVSPHETCMTAEMQHPREFEWWMDYDFRWVETCDAVYKMPYPSTNGDRETAHAQEIGKPVFLSYDTLFTLPVTQPIMAHAQPAGGLSYRYCWTCGLPLDVLDHTLCRGVA